MCDLLRRVWRAMPWNQPPLGSCPERPVPAWKWTAEGQARFGDDPLEWSFECPACGVVCTAQDWLDAGAEEDAVARSCIGRWTRSRRDFWGQGPGPCNYAGDGPVRLNPVWIRMRSGEVFSVFAFAEVE
jgi:hypothetical protein